MVTLTKDHLTPAEMRAYREAAQDARHYEQKLREARQIMRRIKDVVRKRAAK